MIITHREQSVDVARFSLAITPHPCHRLLVIGWIPVRVKHYQPICPDKVKATAASLATQHEDEIWALKERNRWRLKMDYRTVLAVA